jgi:hypothetical protein
MAVLQLGRDSFTESLAEYFRETFIYGRRNFNKYGNTHTV